MNNKQLYNSIMKSVAVTVKKAINEAYHDGSFTPEKGDELVHQIFTKNKKETGESIANAKKGVTNSLVDAYNAKHEEDGSQMTIVNQNKVEIDGDVYAIRTRNKGTSSKQINFSYPRDMHNVNAGIIFIDRETNDAYILSNDKMEYIINRPTVKFMYVNDMGVANSVRSFENCDYAVIPMFELRMNADETFRKL